MRRTVTIFFFLNIFVIVGPSLDAAMEPTGTTIILLPEKLCSSLLLLHLIAVPESGPDQRKLNEIDGN